MRSFLLSLFFVLTCCPALRLDAAELPVLKIYFQGTVSKKIDSRQREYYLREEMRFIRKQLDSSYHFEENRLIRRYALSLDQEYSLAKTLEYLKNEKYYCE